VVCRFEWAEGKRHEKSHEERLGFKISVHTKNWTAWNRCKGDQKSKNRTNVWKQGEKGPQKTMARGNKPEGKKLV